MNTNSLRKSVGTFAPERSLSMEVPPNSVVLHSTKSKLRKSLSVEFPTSPETRLEEEVMIHHAHSQHPLALVAQTDPFTCTGCKEQGAGKRFACQNCDFQLHDFCALSPPALKNHPLHAQHQLVLHAKPKQGGILWPRCDVCSKATKGFTFRCGVCSFQMHPCCAMLSSEMKFPVHPHPLKLLPPSLATSSSGDPAAGFTCSECKRKRLGRVYRCTRATDQHCDYYLHAVCAKSFINGLQANGIKNSDTKPSMLGPAARLASQVIIEFIGGLFEGFGEAVGQAVIQNIARGRRSSSRRSNY